jgi:hypothetical protein
MTKYYADTMRPGKVIPLALVMMSVLFFCDIIAPLTDQMPRDLGASFDISMILSSVIGNHTLPGLISLCGGIAFLLSTRVENPSWCLGIPLVVAYAIIVLSPFVAGLIVISDPNPPFWHPGVVLSLLSGYGTVFLLPPCAALFFWSQRRMGRGVPVMTGIALVITLIAMIFTFYLLSPYLVAAGFLPPAQPHYIDGQPVKMADGEGVLFLILASMFGLPVIGICFLALAVLSWFTAGMVVPAPAPEAQP